MSKTKETKRIAVFDDNSVLIGSKEVPIDHAGGVEVGDLKTDGRMKWDKASKSFIPLGHGFGKVTTRAPHESDYVMRQIIEALGKAGIPNFELPFQATEWAEWYDAHMKRRHEELATRPK